MWLGNLTEDQTIDFPFNTWDADGDPVTLAGSPALAVYKGNSTTESTAGITLTVDFDGRTGSHHVRIDTSADAFYAVANDYSVRLTAGTVDSKSVNGVALAAFSIENRFNEAIVTSIAADAITAAAIADNAIDAGAIAANAITAAKIATDAITADKIAADAIGSSELAASAVTEIQSGLATQASVDDLPTNAELATALAGADDAVLAAVAAVQADTDNIQTRLPAALVSGRIDASVGAVAANAIDNAALADDAIDANVIAVGALAADAFAAGAITAAALAADAGAEIADAVWDEAISGHLTAGSTGAALNAAGSAGDPWTTPLPGAYGAGTAGKIVGDNLNAPVGDVPTNAELTTALAAADDAVLAAIADLPTNAELATALDPLPTANEIAHEVLKVDWTTVSGEAARSVLNALRALRNRGRIFGGNLLVYEEDDTTVAWQGPVTQTAGDPVTEFDPTT